jgi:Protein phosphatase 2C
VKTQTATLPAYRSVWLLRGASMPGARHLEEAAPCQDVFSTASLAHSEGEIIALLVADGAGSALRSLDGAAIAVSAALASIRRHLADSLPSTGTAWREVIQTIAEDAVISVIAAANALEGCSVEDLGCTFGLALLAAPWLALLTIGDVFCVVRRGDGGWHVPLPPTHAGDDPTRTVLISHPDCLSRAGMVVIEDHDIEACGVSSDGLERSALLRTDAGLEPYAPFLDPLVNRARGGETSAALAGFLLADERLADTTDDDRTFVMAVRK